MGAPIPPQLQVTLTLSREEFVQSVYSGVRNLGVILEFYHDISTHWLNCDRFQLIP